MRAAVLASSLILALSSVAHGDDPPMRGRPEVIHLEEPAPPVVRPKVKRYHRKLPPYSDAAILSDVWTRAWMLIEIDEHGTVTRLKSLKAPGHDLDDIAIREAFGLHFEPARDAFGKPMRVWIVWGFEWPANSWLVATTGLSTAMPEDVVLEKPELPAVAAWNAALDMAGHTLGVTLLGKALHADGLKRFEAELRGKLERIRPASLGQAGRIEGMTPVALNQILLHLRSRRA